MPRMEGITTAARRAQAFSPHRRISNLKNLHGIWDARHVILQDMTESR